MAQAKQSRKPKAVPSQIRLEREARESGDDHDPRRTDKILGISLDEAAARFLNPERPNLLAVEEVLTEDIDPAEAWELLAARELIPIEWTSAGARQIHVDGQRCKDCDDRSPYIGHALDCEQKNSPPTLMAALTLAANPEAVAAVEALAREAFQRIVGSDYSFPPIVWRVTTPSRRAPLSAQRPGRNLRKSSRGPSFSVFDPWQKVLLVREDYHPPPGYLRGPNGKLVNAAGNRVTFNNRQSGYYGTHQSWIAGAITDIQHHWGWALAARETRPNPFTPLVEAWLLGYSIEVVDEDAIVLFAPEPFVRED